MFLILLVCGTTNAPAARRFFLMEMQNLCFAQVLHFHQKESSRRRRVSCATTSWRRRESDAIRIYVCFPATRKSEDKVIPVSASGDTIGTQAMYLAKEN